MFARQYASIVPTSRQYPRSSVGRRPGISFCMKSYAYTRAYGYSSGMIVRPKSWSVLRRESSTSTSSRTSVEKM